jgi:hypothetical protein
VSERREAGIPPSSETQVEPTGWEAEPESTHESERGPSGPQGQERTSVSERREAGIPPSSERGPSGPARRAESGQT